MILTVKELDEHSRSCHPARMTGRFEAPEMPIPALLREARGSYGRAVRDQLVAAGFDDMPRNGPFVLGGIVTRGVSSGDLVRQLGVSKQAASQLIDTLVLRGYLERQANPDDRRRMTLYVTERGRAAAATVASAVQATDDKLDELISPAGVASLRTGLVALIEIRDGLESAGAS
jgi:DNA-binding MarR family transcriptional regulator